MMLDSIWPESNGGNKPLEARKQQLCESQGESLIVWERAFALARIKEKVVRAPKEDVPPWLYKGRLNPTLSESELAAFEKEHRITLPEEYRTFLLEVGNGGLGPGYGLSTLAESAENSPTPDLDKPFPFSFRLYAEERARWREELRTHSWEEALARRRERRGGAPPPEREYAQLGVLFLATPDPPWASVYLVITGEDRGMMWMYGGECGWVPEAPTSDEDERQIDNFRGFFRWYEDWLDEIVSKQ
jgi:hypothetical protein